MAGPGPQRSHSPPRRDLQGTGQPGNAVAEWEFPGRSTGGRVSGSEPSGRFEPGLKLADRVAHGNLRWTERIAGAQIARELADGTTRRALSEVEGHGSIYADRHPPAAGQAGIAVASGKSAESTTPRRLPRTRQPEGSAARSEFSDYGARRGTRRFESSAGVETRSQFHRLPAAGNIPGAEQSGAVGAGSQPSDSLAERPIRRTEPTEMAESERKLACRSAAGDFPGAGQSGGTAPGRQPSGGLTRGSSRRRPGHAGDWLAEPGTPCRPAPEGSAGLRLNSPDRGARDNGDGIRYSAPGTAGVSQAALCR